MYLYQHAKAFEGAQLGASFSRGHSLVPCKLTCSTLCFVFQCIETLVREGLRGAAELGGYVIERLTDRGVGCGADVSAPMDEQVRAMPNLARAWPTSMAWESESETAATRSQCHAVPRAAHTVTDVSLLWRMATHTQTASRLHTDSRGRSGQQCEKTKTVGGPSFMLPHCEVTSAHTRYILVREVQ